MKPIMGILQKKINNLKLLKQMKNISYKLLIIFLLSLFLFSCGNKENHNENDGHSHDEEEKTEVNEEHNESEEVMLSQQQFDALKMKIDT